MLPGTKHIIQFFERRPGLSLEGYSYSPFGVYDIISDTWLSKPRDYEEIRDPDDQFTLELHFAHMVARHISRSHQHLLDDIKDLKLLSPNTKMYEDKMDELRQDIYTLLDYARKLDKDRKDAYKSGWGIPRNTYENIVYKVVQYSQMGDLLYKLENQLR